MDGRINKLAVLFKVLIMNDYLFPVRIVEAVHLPARFACENDAEITGACVKQEKFFFYLFLVHLIAFRDFVKRTTLCAILGMIPEIVEGAKNSVSNPIEPADCLYLAHGGIRIQLAGGGL